jgi:putative tricarboxylic transport membrane protein
MSRPSDFAPAPGAEDFANLSLMRIAERHLREQGVNVVYSQFWGVAGTPGMDPAVVAWWADKFRKATQTKAWQDGLNDKLQLGRFYGLAEADAYFKREQDTFRKLLTSVGLAKAQ